MTRIVDLRSLAEAAAAPHPLGTAPGYRLVPLVDPDAERRRDPQAETTLLEIYRGSLQRNGRSIAAGLAAVADAPPGPVLVHCAAGKDRTGILVALLLRLAGVTREAVAADYAASDLRPADVQAGPLPVTPEGAAGGRLAGLQHARPGTMLGLLEHLDRTYGGAAAYAHSIGVTAAQLRAVRHRLRDAPAVRPAG